MVFGMPSVSLCKNVWICALLAPERLDGFYSYSVLGSFIRHTSVFGEYEHSTSKIGALEMRPKIYNGDFLAKLL
jgi:hypothetical protein